MVMIVNKKNDTSKKKWKNRRLDEEQVRRRYRNNEGMCGSQDNK